VNWSHGVGVLLVGAICFAPSGLMAETPVPVGVSIAWTGEIREDVKLNGSLIAHKRSRLSTEVDGFVSEMLVDDGDRVERGAVVLRLDQRLARIDRDAAYARLEEARARHIESDRRYRELFELQETRHVADTTVSAAKAQIEIDAAMVKQAEAQLERARELLRRHVVQAPFGAVVSRKLVEQGEWVETNTAVAELVDVSLLRLEVPVPQFYYASVQIDTEVTIRLDAMPDRTFAARVTRKIPIGDAASRTFRVWIDIPNEEKRLAPGMSARVSLHIAARGEAPALLLPRDAVVRKPDGTANVWVIVVEDGVTKAVPRRIETGRSYRDHVEIVHGDVSPGQQVVIRGNEILQPGQSVLVAEDTAQDI
jgi:membrane fusion protein, multidrug efflux system